MSTLLKAEYQSVVTLEYGSPGIGRGTETTRVRNEVEGIEVSKEVVGLMLESFSMKGGRISVGALSARGPRLKGLFGQY